MWLWNVSTHMDTYASLPRNRCAQMHAIIAGEEQVIRVSTVSRREPRVPRAHRTWIFTTWRTELWGSRRGWWRCRVREWERESRWVSHLVDGAKAREIKRKREDVYVCLCVRGDLWIYECVRDAVCLRGSVGRIHQSCSVETQVPADSPEESRRSKHAVELAYVNPPRCSKHTPTVGCPMHSLTFIHVHL